MTDFFREVYEELRNDRMRSLWRNYGKFILAGIVFIVVATAAYRFYLHWSQTRSAQSGDQFLQALEFAGNGDFSKAQTILAQLEKEGYGAYPTLARLRLAGTLLADKKPVEALAAYDRIAGDRMVSTEMRDYAVLQAAMIGVDHESYDAVVKRTQPLLVGDNPWRYLAREARLLSAWKAGRVEEAAKIVAELKAAISIPQGLRQRIAIFEDLIIAAGGTIPGQGGAG